MLKEIYDSYEAHRAKEKNEERLIALHQKRLRNLENKGGWIKKALIPLANRISQELGMPYDIYGPFGLGCSTSIYFFPSGRVESIVEAESYCITLHPSYANGFHFTYNTGENRGENVEAPLPDDLVRILEIIRNNHHMPKAKEE